MITYPNAVDENGEVHGIDSITEENRRGHKYFCLGCDQEMVPVLSKAKEQHFRHKVNDVCNPETYLHNLAKKYLAKQFETQAKFEVSYHVQCDCSQKDSCQIKGLIDSKGCTGVSLKTYNLKELYDTCQIEGVYNGYRADVLLTNSQKPETPPIFLEVSVSHDCTPEKIESGIHIIEIKVKSETDFKRPIEENKGGLSPKVRVPKRPSYCSNQRESEPSFIKFHNFKHETRLANSVKLDRFVLYYDGYMDEEEQSVLCGELKTDHHSDAVFEVAFLKDYRTRHSKPTYDLCNYGFCQAMLHNHPVRHCFYCQDYRRCMVPIEEEQMNYRTGQMEKKVTKYYIRALKDSEINKFKLAAECEKWSLDQFTVQRVISSYDSKRVFIWDSKRIAEP